MEIRRTRHRHKRDWMERTTALSPSSSPLLFPKVRSAINEGRVLAAMELVNDMNPETLDTHPRLYFHLYLQHLIELIRQDKVEEALTFAQVKRGVRERECVCV